MLVGGPLVDDGGNLYVTSIEGIYKLNREGQVLWTFRAPGTIADSASIMGDALYGTDVLGHVFAVDLASGETLWQRRHAETKGGDTGSVEGHSGVLVCAVEEAQHGGGGQLVLGVNATDGALLWDFRPDAPVWNLVPAFPGDDTLVFQDSGAKVYRLGLHEGELRWQAGGGHGERGATWTGGGAALGPNGVVYAASSQVDLEEQQHIAAGGGVHAYALDDGELLWERRLERPFLAWPAVGRLAGHAEGLSVVVATGAGASAPWKLIMVASLPVCWSGALLVAFIWTLVFSCSQSGWRRVARRFGFLLAMGTAAAPAVAAAYVANAATLDADILALAADTGEPQWHYRLPSWPHVSAAGDNEGFFTRLLRPPYRFACLPGAFSSPRVDGAGVVYIGYHNGMILSIKDGNGDGTISETEVSSFDTGAAFPHSGPAFAPGIFAFASCDSLHVWEA